MAFHNYCDNCKTCLYDRGTQPMTDQLKYAVDGQLRPMPDIAQLLQLEADNQRLREELERITGIIESFRNMEIGDRKLGTKCIAWYCTFHTSLAQTAPTTGLLDVVRAAVALMASDDPTLKGQMHPLEIALDDAVKALPPETLKMMEEIK
ncbi:MAG: hypothetical protein ABFD50_07965 [Smithella sp.]